MKREVILETALELFSEKGFASTSTALLARRAGVAEGTIFRHFAGKEDIFSELISGLGRYLIQTFESGFEQTSLKTSVLRGKKGDSGASYFAVPPPQNTKNPSGLENIALACCTLFDLVRNNRRLFVLFFSDAPSRYGSTDSAVFREVREIYSYITGFIVRNIQKGQADGSISTAIPSESTAVVMASTITGFARNIHFRLVDYNSELVGIFLKHLHAILAPAASGAPEAESAQQEV